MYNCIYCAYMYVCGCVTVGVLVFIHCMHSVGICMGMCIFHRTCKSSFQVKVWRHFPLVAPDDVVSTSCHDCLKAGRKR